jgi:hypothetical protein
LKLQLHGHQRWPLFVASRKSSLFLANGNAVTYASLLAANVVYVVKDSIHQSNYCSGLNDLTFFLFWEYVRSAVLAREGICPPPPVEQLSIYDLNLSKKNKIRRKMI